MALKTQRSILHGKAKEILALELTWKEVSVNLLYKKNKCKQV